MNYAKNDKILQDFEKMISFYERKANSQNWAFYDDVGDCLTLFLLEMLRAGKCISQRYVAVALRNEFYRLCRKNNEITFDDFGKVERLTSPGYTERLDLRTDIKKALLCLPEKQAEVLKMRFYSDLTFAEIAFRKNVSPQAVSQTQKRALDRLKNVL